MGRTSVKYIHISDTQRMPDISMNAEERTPDRHAEQAAHCHPRRLQALCQQTADGAKKATSAKLRIPA